MVAILPEAAVVPRCQHQQRRCIGEPLLTGQHPPCQRRQCICRRRRQRQYRVLHGVVVVQPRYQPFHVLYQQETFGRMQAATRGHVLLQELGITLDLLHRVRHQRTLQHLGQQRQRQRALRVEIAAGGATRQQCIERGLFAARQRLVVALHRLHHRRWRPQALAQAGRGVQPLPAHVLHAVHGMPARMAMGQRSQWPPLAAPQRLVAHLVPHLARWVGQQQALFDQAGQHGRAGIGGRFAPAVRAEPAQQLALLGVHRQWLVQVGGQRHPADLAVHLGVAGQHRAQVQGDRLARLEHQAGAAAQAHRFPSLCRTAGIAATTAARPTLATCTARPSMAGCRGRYE